MNTILIQRENEGRGEGERDATHGRMVGKGGGEGESTTQGRETQHKALVVVLISVA